MVKDLRSPVRNVDPAARVTTFGVDLFNNLNAAGLRYLKGNQGQYKMRMMMDWVRPPTRTSSLKSQIKVEHGMKHNLCLFIH